MLLLCRFVFWGFMFFFFKQKTAYEMRISDWSSDVCSSDLARTAPPTDVFILLITFFLTVFADLVVAVNVGVILAMLLFLRRMSSAEIGRASCRERVCQYV